MREGQAALDRPLLDQDGGMMNDATTRLDIECGHCDHHWDLSEEDFVAKAEREGLRWECPMCSLYCNVYIVKKLRPELWVWVKEE